MRCSLGRLLWSISGHPFILLAWVAISHLAQGHGLVAAGAGLALILCVFGTVVLHELGHSLVAKHYGSRDAMIEAGKKRNDLRDVVMSKLGREVMPK